MKKLFLSVMFIFGLSATALAQPTISSSVPGQNALNIAVNSDISVTFDMNMNQVTFTAGSSFNVVGSISGSMDAGIFSFEPGEAVVVTLTTAIQSSGAVALAEPYSFGFMTTASAGPPTLSQNFGTGSENTRSVAFGDVDGDGNLDIAVGNSWAQNVVYRNNGSDFSTLTPWNFGTGNNYTESVAFGDVDGDGYLDLAVGNRYQQNVVYRNNGTDFSTLPSWNFGTGSENTRSVAFGDVDGNGDLDIAVGNYDSQQNVVYRNNGSDFTTLTPWNFGTGNDYTESVAFGDVDGDGDLDVAVGN
ncbi:MAG: hypothetical protein B6244_11210, partial [Candidatus Cloacimonetes bacterium 4572_55]